jgi:hypothetical protein
LDVAAHRSLVRASDEATSMSEAPSCIRGVLVPSVRSEPYLNRRIEVQPRCLVTPERGRAPIARAWSICSPAHHIGSRLVSRFQSSHHYAARSLANFGIEGHQQPIDLVWLWFRSPHFGLPRKRCGLLNRHTRFAPCGRGRFGAPTTRKGRGVQPSHRLSLSGTAWPVLRTRSC